MFNDQTKEEAGEHMFSISGMGVTIDPLGVFSIDDKTGMVYVHKPIDREKYVNFHVREPDAVA